VLVAVLGGLLGPAAATDVGPGTAALPQAPPVLVPVVDGAALDPGLVRAAVRPLLRGGSLGRGATPARIVDLATGQVLFDQADAPTTPASTVKLVTAASVLDALGPDATVTTRTVLQQREGRLPRLVLVGGGDPTLASTDERVGRPGTQLEPASLAELARRTRWTLAARGIDRVRLGYDDGLFTGPALHPTWSTGFPAAGIVAPVSALQVDQGRVTPTGISRVADPAARAADVFARQLAEAGLEVVGAPRRVRARASAEPVRAVVSPPIGTLVERALATSDNDIAEALARLAALGAGLPGSFEGVAQRGEALLAGLGIRAPSTVVDGSGLSRANQLRPADLTTLLRAVGAEGPIASGLPVAAATGSLGGRFQVGASRPAAGVVRAKTGTLTGVVGLAGYLSRPDGRLLAFAVLDETVPVGALGARRAIDVALAALVTCDCAAGAGPSPRPSP
jgi:D-alanyl-D-alanine carboxypeptidase/D-alanyl-D-alanine-endopeptidase (penicillin-binding protein 4)